MAELTQHFLATTLLIFLTTTISQFHFIFSSKDSKPSIGFTLSLIPADSPDSPLYAGNLTRHERMQRLMNITQAKAALYRISSSGNATTTTTPPPLGRENIQLPMIRQSYYYYAVKVGIGNPVYSPYLLMDTGGGLIWTQCAPCRTCYPMEYGIFDPRQSSTYEMLPCSNPLCQRGGYFRCVDNQYCVYISRYGIGKNNPKTQGVASTERFTFSTKEGGSSSIDGMIFGCSNYVRNFELLMSDKKISGVLGMSLARHSLLTQLKDQIDGKFSYCMPSILDEIAHPVFLSFGTDVPRISEPLENTLFLSPPDPHFFYLDLRDISVGPNRIGFPKGTFQVDKDGRNGFFIDSGAPFTMLDQNTNGVNAYLAVVSAFDAHYNQYHGLPKAKDDQFDYCYGLPNGFNDFLTMTYHFHPRAEFVVHSRDAHYFNAEMGYFCVAIVQSSARLSILGAYHQQNKHIVYNLDLKALQFATVTCPN